ncbi:hypothetical protein FQN60_004012 [Etheostoma spectabile]|uniref:Uncharacterized protein n=1 Tax=Etheostoma spectabile TaxID=54343 RepID=A0A5J5CSH2_9PERO|nr:hypothetical protein FQN60_004012 [Etheostoma spectabile]
MRSLPGDVTVFTLSQVVDVTHLTVETEEEGVPFGDHWGSLRCLLPRQALKESPGLHQSVSTFHNS